MSDFTNDLNGMTFGDYQDDEQRGDGLPRIQWRQGDPKQQTPGYFFFAKDNAPEGFTPGAPWVACQEYFELTRTRSEGWKAEQLPVCVICARAQPYQRPPQGTDGQKTWIDKWPKGAPSGLFGQHADVLLIASGMEELGPACWSTNSTTVAFAIIGGPDPKRAPQGGILHRLREEVLRPMGAAFKPAKDLRKQPWLCWVTIATQRDAKGMVVFTPTAGKDVTLPVLVLPEKVDLAWLKQNYSGHQMAQYGEDMRFQYDAWRNTRMTNDAPMAIADARALPPGRNIPVAIAVEDEPPF